MAKNKSINLSTRIVNALERVNIPLNATCLKEIIENREIKFRKGVYFYNKKEMKNFGNKSFKELCESLGINHLSCPCCNGTGIIAIS